MTGDASQWRLGVWWQVLIGALIGATTFLVAVALVPATASKPADHDLSLAANLGFIFPPIIGLWTGLVQGSLRKLLICIAVGVVIGTTYKALCGSELSGDHFIAIIVSYPCLLGGFAAVGMGSGNGAWSEGIVQRFLKGLVAGFVLGIVYMGMLNALAVFMLPIFGPLPPDFDAIYRRMMWRAGTIALSVASGLFLPVFHWAAQLHRLAAPENKLP